MGGRSVVLAKAQRVELTNGRKAQVRTAGTVPRRTRGIAKSSSQAILWGPCRRLVFFVLMVPEEDWAIGVAKLETAAFIGRRKGMTKLSLSNCKRDC